MNNIKEIHFFVAKDRDTYFKIGAIGEKDAIMDYVKDHFGEHKYIDSLMCTATSGRKVAKGIEFVFCKTVPSIKYCFNG